MWAGIDVGGRRKGFHAAAVDERGVSADPVRLPDVATAFDWLLALRPVVVAVDSPRSPAPDGAASRACERALARALCGIRYTPERGRLATSTYYEWIEHGLELYAALAGGPWEVIECFPTAAWTRWAGSRAQESRTEWSSRALGRLGLTGVPARLSQDGRDAIAAAVTARLYAEGKSESFGEIVVPRQGC